MSIHYIGNCEWEPVTPVEWTVDQWGVDRGTIVYAGRADKKTAFLDLLKSFSLRLTGYPSVHLNTWANTESKPYWPMVTLTFAGFRSGTIPPAKAVDTTSAQSAPAFVTGVSKIYYAASRTQWTWFETSKPSRDKPRYATVRDPLDPFENITNGVAVSTELRAAYQKSRTRVTDYTREEIAKDKLWACSSTVDYIFGNPAE